MFQRYIAQIKSFFFLGFFFPEKQESVRRPWVILWEFVTIALSVKGLAEKSYTKRNISSEFYGQKEYSNCYDNYGKKCNVLYIFH